MKKIFLLIVILLSSSMQVFADDLDVVKSKFNNYIYSANTYSPDLLNYYSPSAKIIRQIVKPDGTTANATTDMATYAKQLKISQSTAKLRNYKNKYN